MFDGQRCGLRLKTCCSWHVLAGLYIDVLFCVFSQMRLCCWAVDSVVFSDAALAAVNKCDACVVSFLSACV